MYNIIRFIIDESLRIFIYGVIIFMVHCNNTVVSKIVTVIRANDITMILIWKLIRTVSQLTRQL